MTTVDLTPHDDRPALPDPAPGDPAPGPEPADIGGYGTSDVLEVVPEVSEDKMRRVLTVIGLGAHTLAGHPQIEEHWAFTDGELDALTPPLTAYVNRSQRLRAAVDRGDIVTVAVTLGLYVKRNVDLSAEIAAAEEQDTVLEDPVVADGAPIQPFDKL